MKCPVCKKEMEEIKLDISYNNKSGQRYDRTLYNCKACDTWLRAEIPKK